MRPYYEDEQAVIYLGDCREILPALTGGASAMVTDPPYGIGWRRGHNAARSSKAHAGIRGDKDTTARDEMLTAWGDGPAILFGSLAVAPPAGLVQTLIWRKPADAGVVGSVTGFRRDVEAIYLCGTIPRRTVRWSSVLESRISNIGSPSSPAGKTGHPHAKPTDLMERLISLVRGVILDPFAGSGSTLVAAKQLGRRAIGIEIEERYCEVAAKRLGQEVLDLAAATDPAPDCHCSYDAILTADEAKQRIESCPIHGTAEGALI